ncbi:hypothetical protein TorRG33x02_286970, partial [Trema orientale]
TNPSSNSRPADNVEHCVLAFQARIENMEHQLDAKIDGLALKLRETLAIIRVDLAVGRDYRQQWHPRDRALSTNPPPLTLNNNQHRQLLHDYYFDLGDE